jgi:hypothetical protein
VRALNLRCVNLLPPSIPTATPVALTDPGDFGMSGFAIFLVVLAIVAFLVWQRAATTKALATTRVESPLPPDEAVKRIRNTFGGAQALLWTEGAGPASINMRRRGKDGGITMSINVERGSRGGAVVDMWTSSYNRYFGFLANFAGAVNSKKKVLARQLMP